MYETRIEFQDNIYDAFGLLEPHEINFMNIGRDYQIFSNVSQYFSLSLFPSNTVKVQKRSVYNFLMMFGDVGGLHDFITLVLTAFLGPVSEKF